MELRITFDKKTSKRTKRFMMFLLSFMIVTCSYIAFQQTLFKKIFMIFIVASCLFGLIAYIIKFKKPLVETLTGVEEYIEVKTNG